MEKLGIIEATCDANWDTDQDGMFDQFENLKGTNPNLADNNEDPDGDGYTNLEDYLTNKLKTGCIINTACFLLYKQVKKK